MKKIILTALTVMAMIVSASAQDSIRNAFGYNLGDTFDPKDGILVETAHLPRSLNRTLRYVITPGKDTSIKYFTYYTIDVSPTTKTIVSIYAHGGYGKEYRAPKELYEDFFELKRILNSKYGKGRHPYILSDNTTWTQYLEHEGKTYRRAKVELRKIITSDQLTSGNRGNMISIRYHNFIYQSRVKEENLAINALKLKEETKDINTGTL